MLAAGRDSLADGCPDKAVAPLGEAAAAVADSRPLTRRMSPVEHPLGMTFLMDNWKATLESVEEFIAFMRSSRARRKIAIIGTISDYSGSAGEKYRRLVAQAEVR